MKSKVCAKCKKRKRFSAFNQSLRGKFGLHSYCRTCDAANKRKWYLVNKVHVVEKSKEWNKQNSDRFSKNQHKHKKKYADRYSEYYKQWAETNRENCRLRKHKYYAQLKRQLGEVSPNIIEHLFVDQKGLCFYCNRELQEYHLEHMLPISKGGLHDDSNLCISCPTCNLRKHNKTAEEFKWQLEEEKSWQ